MLDEIGEGFFHAVGRALGYIFVDFLFNIVFYYTGWVFLKIVTVGSYPPKHDPYAWKQPNHSHGFVIFVGIVAWSVLAAYVVHRLSWEPRI